MSSGVFARGIRTRGSSEITERARKGERQKAFVDLYVKTSVFLVCDAQITGDVAW